MGSILDKMVFPDHFMVTIRQRPECSQEAGSAKVRGKSVSERGNIKCKRPEAMLGKNKLAMPWNKTVNIVRMQ